MLQARALGDVLGPTGRHRWTAVTILVAGLGWAAASAPAALSGDDGGATPSLLWVLPGAALLGAVMGVALGAAQAWALRHRVRHPWRWIAGSAAGWTAAMPVIFLGATGVGATWPWWIVVPIGTLTGLAAGLALGIVSGPFLDTLDGPAWHHRLVLGMLSTPPAVRPTWAAAVWSDSAWTAPGPAGTTGSRSRPRAGDQTDSSCCPRTPSERPGGATWMADRPSRCCSSASGCLRQAPWSEATTLAGALLGRRTPSASPP